MRLEFRKELWCRHNAQAYPDALAQCVYTACIHAFSASWSSFDDNFKSSLVEIIYLWQTGTEPCIIISTMTLPALYNRVSAWSNHPEVI